MSSIQDLLAKAHRSAEAARGLCEDELYDDATSRAYYAMFDAAQALILSVDASFQGHTHRTVLSEFSRQCVKPGLVSKEWGSTISRAQGARHVADYDKSPIQPAKAAEYARLARELVDKVISIVSPADRPTIPNVSARELLQIERAEEHVKRALAEAFCSALDRKGEICPSGMVEELTLYGTRESLTP